MYEYGYILCTYVRLHAVLLFCFAHTHTHTGIERHERTAPAPLGICSTVTFAAGRDHPVQTTSSKYHHEVRSSLLQKNQPTVANRVSSKHVVLACRRVQDDDAAAVLGEDSVGGDGDLES